MLISIRSIGHSKLVVIPQKILAQAGLDGETIAVVTVEGSGIVLRKSEKPVREGWAAAAQAVAASGEATLVMGAFGNLDDEALQW